MGALILATACGFLLSVLVTWLALIYARRRGLLDQPGRRRSHSQPTPRGGGAGIVLSVLLVGASAWWLLARSLPWFQPAALLAAVLAVALTGWRDDHAPLPVVPRILVHIGAAAIVGATALAAWASIEPLRWWTLLPAVLILVGYVNAHNFMDGIDGILGQQGLFVMLGYGVLAAWIGVSGIAALAFATAGGCLGFLAFNVPPARIFMGDVGSGTLGLVIGAVGILLVSDDFALLWPCLILSSAFLTDSGLTLARRALAGQRWYAPHRQHLYQWLVRVNWSHARTDAAYMIWNLAVATPLAWAAVRWPASGWWAFVAAYVLAGAVWYVGKRACLAIPRRSASHENA